MASGDELPDNNVFEDDAEKSADPQVEAAAEAVAHKRVWDDEVGAGDLVPFDPAQYRAKLTPEQLAALEKPKG